MRRFIAFVILLALGVIFIPFLQPKVNASSVHSAAFTIGQKAYVADGSLVDMDAAPFLYQDRSYVPVRFLGNALGIEDSDIFWDSDSGTVVFSLENTKLQLSVRSTSLCFGDGERVMDVFPVLKGDRVYLPARWVAEALGYEVLWDEHKKAVLIGPPGKTPLPPADGDQALPVVGTAENLKKLLAQVQQRPYQENIMKSAERMDATAAQGSTPVGAGSQDAVNTQDFSRTNLQVEGVDEADIVKTDGTYIYHVNRERITISKAYPAQEMQVISTLDFTGKGFSPLEIYVDNKYLVVMGHAYGGRDIPIDKPMPEGDLRSMPEIMPPIYQQNRVKVVVYDIAEKSKVKEVRELELTGDYVSSRKIGSAVYLVVNKGIYYYPEGTEPVPQYRDSATGSEFKGIDYTAIRYFPGFTEANYLMVAGFSLERPREEAKISTYLGAGQNIYASTKNLYVAVSQHGPTVLTDGPELIPVPPQHNTSKTKIHRFSLKDGKMTYAASGEVPGSILNQFSMDEHNNHFRIATTVGDVWWGGNNTSRNNVYILDQKLAVTGKIENIAPGEKIYSTRFMGDRGYMVTFKTVDPLFVIDLKEPREPRILGALKIPGYSDYLHPYDENHIIGFGKDTVEIGQKDWEGRQTGSMAFYLGMKMAVFDVSDVKNPVEMFNEIIGDRGTDSQLLQNHKALLFSKEKNLLAFPVTVMEVQGGSVKPGTNFPEYGKFAFQGAYVYSLDLKNGFNLRGKISHLSQEDYLKAGNYWYDSEKNVERILYINDNLYTLSNKFIKANSLNTLSEIKTLEIK